MIDGEYQWNILIKQIQQQQINKRRINLLSKQNITLQQENIPLPSRHPKLYQR